MSSVKVNPLKLINRFKEIESLDDKALDDIENETRKVMRQERKKRRTNKLRPAGFR